MPPEVSAPISIQAQRWSRKTQSVMVKSSVGRAIILPARPRPDFSEIQSSTVSKSQRSMATRRQESTSLPSVPPFTETSRNRTSSQ